MGCPLFEKRNDYLYFNKIKTELHIFIKHLFFALFCILLVENGQAQPMPCGANADMQPFCNDACIICDIDGFNGINNENQNGVAPDDFCTTTQHNIQWIAFIAGTENISIEVAVGNCQIGWGLEVGIYESINCENPEMVTMCDGEINEFSSQVFTNTQPLTVGQYYFFVMDGNGGDVCSYEISVINGSTLVDPLTTSGAISGFTTACPNTSITYSTEGEIGATEFDWTLNGSFVGGGDSITVFWDTEGIYQLCVTAYNACNEAPPSCQFIEIEAIEPTIVDEIRCAGECIVVADNLLCETIDTDFTLVTANGCDSLIEVSLVVYPNPEISLEVTICEGDTLFVGDFPFYETGSFAPAIPTILGCDSTVLLELTTVVCEIGTNETASDILCFSQASGEIAFFIDSGLPPFTYVYELLGNPTVSGSGNIGSINENVTISSLLAGTYTININDNFGNDAIIIEVIDQPSPLVFEYETTDYNGVGVSCINETDGAISILPNGGTPDYTFQWNTTNGATPFNGMLSNLAAGEYNISVIDDNGCETIQDILLATPDDLMVQAFPTNANCDSLNTGEIQINVVGGVAPYRYALNNGVFQDSPSFFGLIPDVYAATVMDANGCTDKIQNEIFGPQIPVLDLGSDTIVPLGCAYPLTVDYNETEVELITIEWQGPGLSCTDCLDPMALPMVASTYYLSLTSADDCTRTDSIIIAIDNTRSFGHPTAFSPNNDGLNDVFYLTGGKDIGEIMVFKVFDRWGNLIFNQGGFAPNDSSFGWDGTQDGSKKLDMGVYVWFAEVEYLDEVRIVYKGSVTLVR